MNTETNKIESIYAVTYSVRNKRTEGSETTERTAFAIKAESPQEAKKLAREELEREGEYEVLEFLRYQVSPTGDRTASTTVTAADEIAAETADWRKNPDLWILNQTDLAGQVTSILSMPIVPQEVEVLTLLQGIRTRLGRQGGDNWIVKGPIAVPANPEGISALRYLSTLARDFIRKPIEEIGETGSRLALALEGIRKTSNGSDLLRGFTNATPSSHNSPDFSGYRLGVEVDQQTLHIMPKGEILPSPFLQGNIVGKEVDGDQIDSIRSTADLCTSGTIEFLDRFGISYDTEGGEYECGECGCETGDDDSLEITAVESFEITEDMITALDSAGALDAVREELGLTEGPEGWSELLDEKTDDEILAEFAPDEKQKESGVKFDARLFRFTPDFSALEGVEELEFEELARLLPLLSMASNAYLSEGILPPVAGKLEKTGHQYGTGDRSFSWDPERGRLVHRISSQGAFLQYDVRAGHTFLGLVVDGQENIAQLDNHGAVHIPGIHAGPTADLWAGLAQARVDL